MSFFFNVDITTIEKKIKKYNLEECVQYMNGASSYEDEIVDMLKNNFNISVSNENRNVRGLLGNTKQEIDIYLPEYKFGIEFNGDYWHSDIFHMDHRGRSVFHQDKSLLAESSGIFLFHIFEYEWNNQKTKEKIIDRLSVILNKNDVKINARDCVVSLITLDEKNKFLEENHIQGKDMSLYYLALRYNNEIVACMTFKKSKFKKYNYELSRFCCKRNYVVRGGASKLFKYFLNNYCQKDDVIVSYNDITKTSGRLYQILNFKMISINSPNYVWINFQTKDIRSRYQEQTSGEIERMHGLGYHRVCDCGTKTWVYVKEV